MSRDFFAGDIALIAIFERALTDDEHEAIARDGIAALRRLRPLMLSAR